MRLLIDHDHAQIVCPIKIEGDALCLSLPKGKEMTRAQIFDTFGNVGFEAREAMVDVDGEYRYREFRIREFSICTGREAQPKSPTPVPTPSCGALRSEARDNPSAHDWKYFLVACAILAAAAWAAIPLFNFCLWYWRYGDGSL